MTAPMTEHAEAVDAALPAAVADAGATAAEADATATDSSSAYEQQLAAKVAHVQQLFSDFEMPDFEIHRSSPDHYRLRYALHITACCCSKRLFVFACRNGYIHYLAMLASMVSDVLLTCCYMFPQGRVPGMASRRGDVLHHVREGRCCKASHENGLAGASSHLCQPTLEMLLSRQRGRASHGMYGWTPFRAAACL